MYNFDGAFYTVVPFFLLHCRKYALVAFGKRSRGLAICNFLLRRIRPSFCFSTPSFLEGSGVDNFAAPRATSRAAPSPPTVEKNLANSLKPLSAATSYGVGNFFRVAHNYFHLQLMAQHLIKNFVGKTKCLRWQLVQFKTETCQRLHSRHFHRPKDRRNFTSTQEEAYRAAFTDAGAKS